MDPTGVDILAWLHGRTKDERAVFLKRVLGILPENELNQVPNLVSKAKKRRIRKGTLEPKKGEKELASPAESLSVPKKFVSAQEVAGREIADKPWWGDFDLKDIVGIDVEKVEYALQNSKRMYGLKGATVSIKNAEGKALFDTKIYHKAGSFRINRYAKTGFKVDDFVNGTPLEEVKKKMYSILQGKLYVLMGAEDDFRCLDLPITDFEVFDLQNHYYQQHYSAKGKIIIDKLGLRSLCHFYFDGVDIQPDGIFHTAANDAEWTVRLFREVYMKLNCKSKTNDTPYNEIPHYNPEKKVCNCKYCKKQ